MIEIEHETRGAYVETSTIRWNDPLLTPFVAEEKLEAVSAESEDRIEELETEVDDLKAEIEDLKADRNARVRWVIEIARKMLAGNATIRESADLYFALAAQKAGMTPDEWRRQEEEAARSPWGSGFRRTLKPWKPRKQKRRP
jgi:outer membrane murein-binding lipoprotein Lpp